MEQWGHAQAEPSAAAAPPAAPEQRPPEQAPRCIQPQLITASAPDTAEMKGKDEQLSSSAFIF